MIEMLYPKIEALYEDPSYIKRLSQIAEEAHKMKVKLVPIKHEGGLGSEYVAYLDDKERIKALTYKYFTEVVNVPGENSKGNITETPYIHGTLFGYSPEDIRGYYLRFYLLKGLPDKFKDPLEEIEEANGNKFVQPDQFYDRRYQYVKKADKFADFDVKYEKIRKKALEEMKRVSKSKEFEKFVKKHVKDIKDYKFDPKKMLPTK